MANFVRNVSEDLISNLKQEKLFEKIMCDIKKGDKNAVFPAIRNNYISFYYKGGGIFTYGKNGFQSNKKYCFVPENVDESVLTETKLQNLKQKTTFLDAYNDIKERCEKYGGIEAETISSLYRYSGISNSNIVLLDTEVCFVKEKEEDESERNKMNRIDLLFYNKKERQLCFCEAKHFSNSEIWAKKGKKPRVCEQIKRYNEEIKKRHDEIIEQYTAYVKYFNDLFETNLQPPEEILPKTGLIVFGYDKYQSEKLEELLKSDGSLEGIPFDHRQDLVDIQKIYNKIKAQG